MPRVYAPLSSTAIGCRDRSNRLGCVAAMTAVASWTGTVEWPRYSRKRSSRYSTTLAASSVAGVPPARIRAISLSPKTTLFVTSQADHGHRRGLLEHDGCGFRIGPDVELGDRGDVADVSASTHDRQASQMAPKIGVALERERDVRQRADREQVRIVDGAGDVAEVGDRVVRRFGPREVGECRIAETRCRRECGCRRRQRPREAAPHPGGPARRGRPSARRPMRCGSSG